jgi:hypothetical protein
MWTALAGLVLAAAAAAQPTGIVWKKLEITGPGERTRHSMAFDATRGRVVLTAGRGPAVRYHDTWELAGDTWLSRGEAPFSPRTEHATAFDPVRGRVVLFGGWVVFPGQSYFEADTWEYDGKSWEFMAAGGAAGRHGHAMAYDPNLGHVVLYGGDHGGEATHQWGPGWSALPAAGPPERSLHGAAYDTERARWVIFSGTGNRPNAADTWEWDGKTWELKAATGPAPRYGAAMAYDPRLHRVVLFGGNELFGGVLGDMWLWDGAAWSPAEIPCPPARSGHAMVFDGSGERMVMYGGSGNGVSFGDTWVLDVECYADCNRDGALSLSDFGCFQTRFALADPYCDCNEDQQINLADFGCFQTRFALGCP